MVNLLICDDNCFQVRSVASLFFGKSYSIDSVLDLSEAEERVESKPYDLLWCSLHSMTHSIKPKQFYEFAQRLKSLCPSMAIIGYSVLPTELTVSYKCDGIHIVDLSNLITTYPDGMEELLKSISQGN